jgi:hypothetical protein
VQGECHTAYPSQSPPSPLTVTWRTSPSQLPVWVAAGYIAQNEDVVQWMRDTMNVAADLQPCVDEVSEVGLKAGLELPSYGLTRAHAHLRAVHNP